MRVINNPVSRVLGSAISWLLFTASFTLLYQAGAVVMGLGGFCASGGAYVIATPCPDAVALFAPLSIYGGLLAVGIGLVFARGFGTPLMIWAWPILFVGLGVDFLLASFLPGGASNLVIAIVFIVMGLAPLLFVVRAGARPLLIGATNARDEAFIERGRPMILFTGWGRRAGEEPIPDSPTDWAVALGLSLPLIVVGAWLGVQTFRAASAG